MVQLRARARLVFTHAAYQGTLERAIIKSKTKLGLWPAAPSDGTGGEVSRLRSEARGALMEQSAMGVKSEDNERLRTSARDAFVDANAAGTLGPILKDLTASRLSGSRLGARAPDSESRLDRLRSDACGAFETALVNGSLHAALHEAKALETVRGKASGDAQGVAAQDTSATTDPDIERFRCQIGSFLVDAVEDGRLAMSLKEIAVEKTPEQA